MAGLGGTLTYGDVWDDITDEEIDYYMRKHLRTPPEARYQAKKKDWQWHESSWWARRGKNSGIPNSYDGQGCNGITGCVPSCRFYPGVERIENDEVIAHYQEWKRKRDSMTREEKRERRQRVHNYNLLYDDDTDEQRIQRELQREKYQREHPQWKQWF